MTGRFEQKNEHEIEADRLLAEDTARRGSGLTSRPPKPAREMLVEDFAVLAEAAAHWDEYPSDNDGFEMEQNLRARFLHHALSLLTDKQRTAIELVTMQGWSYRRAGREMGLAPGTVHSYVRAGTDKIKAKLEKDVFSQILFPETFADPDADSEEAEVSDD